MRVWLVIAALCAGLAAACTTEPDTTGCEAGAVRLITGYDSAPDGLCERPHALDKDFLLFVKPEADPINPSPWYAFTLDGEAGQYTVQMRYTLSQHRYWPWVREGDSDWNRLPAEQFSVSASGTEVTFDLTLGVERLQIAAQPPYTLEHYSALERRWPDSWRTIGQSVEGRDLRAKVLPPLDENAGWVLLLSRQHPPEIPGAWAFEAFGEEVLRLRQTGALRSGLILVPLLNPDGVEAGYWRLNENQVDLNRDWRARSQPEVQAVHDLLASFSLEPGDLELVVDFHATIDDRIYLPQSEELPAASNARLEAWLGAMDADGLFEALEPRRTNPRRRVSAKGVFTDDWQTVAITWEAGDETPEGDIRDYARRAARLWVQSPD